MSGHKNTENGDQPKAATTTEPRIDKKESVASTKWLALETWHYTDQEGKQRQWDVATRTTKPKLSEQMSTPGHTRSTADAVVIIPLLHSKSSSAEETLLVEQFRPPLGRATLEFPAGLVDAGETIEQCALRELKEETGFVGEFGQTVPSRAVCMSPGLATETVHVVLVTVDLDLPCNQGSPQPELDDGEHVTVQRVDLNAGLKTLLDNHPAMPIMGLYLFAVGFQLGQEQQQSKKRSFSSDAEA